ncbi:hypothetical protein SAMN05192539_1001279 [Paraburkholderia diazotrophica]|uniref:Uncharacterized protein n=2 Tax=Paraburkholderia diazotrophica TaxID=667676 RepID=A0A1H6QIU8_9BURK|nr:hypothetical protein SAMN05192539_1001279 [Paraburkholderia diazotrophica]
MTCTQERFERDTAHHEMTILRDNGVDRHIMFRQPGNSAYWFEILTWPGTLCIKGDMGTYVFSRLTDMFAFFRTDRGNDPSKLYINEGYWCEKLQAVDCNGYGDGKAREFDAENFERHVRDHIESHLEGYEITDERRAELMERIRDEVLNHSHDGEVRAFDALMEFHDDEFPRLFEDCWEWSCKEYTFRFIWNLYAIAWAIRQYDAAKATVEA